MGERRPGRLDGQGRELVRRIDVEQLAPASCPRDTRAAGSRDLPETTVHVRKRSYVNLGASRFTRLVGEIASIRRDVGPGAVPEEEGTDRRARRRRQTNQNK